MALFATGYDGESTLTRTGLDWTHKYPAIAKAVASLGARQAYLDAELCGVGSGGITSFKKGESEAFHRHIS
jgi:bifunctional non-homologous end joining protein LigD